MQECWESGEKVLAQVLRDTLIVDDFDDVTAGFAKMLASGAEEHQHLFLFMGSTDCLCGSNIAGIFKGFDVLP